MPILQTRKQRLGEMMGLAKGRTLGSWLGQDFNSDPSIPRLNPTDVKAAKAEAVGPGS